MSRCRRASRTRTAGRVPGRRETRRARSGRRLRNYPKKTGERVGSPQSQTTWFRCTTHFLSGSEPCDPKRRKDSLEPAQDKFAVETGKSAHSAFAVGFVATVAGLISLPPLRSLLRRLPIFCGRRLRRVSLVGSSVRGGSGPFQIEEWEFRLQATRTAEPLFETYFRTVP